MIAKIHGNLGKTLAGIYTRIPNLVSDREPVFDSVGPKSTELSFTALLYGAVRFNVAHPRKKECFGVSHKFSVSWRYAFIAAFAAVFGPPIRRRIIDH
jgi:hypothetical protein